MTNASNDDQPPSSAHLADPEINKFTAAQWSNLGVELKKSGELVAAEACQRRAVSLAPDHAGILLNFGNVLSANNRLTETIAVRERTYSCDPSAMNAALLVGALRANNLHEQALAMGQKLMLSHSDDILAYEMAHVALASASYELGFQLYRRRWDANGTTKPYPEIAEWLGTEISDSTLLVVAEQGLGDTLAMSRYIPVLSGLAGKVTVAVYRPLLRLFEQADWGDNVTIVPLGDVEGMDFKVHMMDLPGILQTDINTIPAPFPFLKDVSDAQSTSERKIGICWGGTTGNQIADARHLPIESFLPLLGVPNVQVFSLYKGDGDEILDEMPYSMVFHDLGRNDQDLLDAAKNIAAMDHIVTCDTGLAHLAGCLGKPVTVLLPFSAFWMYQSQGSSTPWYPSMRLIRQPLGHVGKPSLAPLLAEWLDTPRTEDLMTPLSPSELFDRLSILRLKNERLNASARNRALLDQLHRLQTIRDNLGANCAGLEAELDHIHQQLWDLEEQKRCVQGTAFQKVCEDIFAFNRDRARVKREIDHLFHTLDADPKSDVWKSVSSQAHVKPE